MLSGPGERQPQKKKKHFVVSSSSSTKNRIKVRGPGGRGALNLQMATLWLALALVKADKVTRPAAVTQFDATGQKNWANIYIMSRECVDDIVR